MNRRFRTRINENSMDLCSDIFDKVLIIYKVRYKEYERTFSGTTIISSILKCLNDEDLMWELLDTAMCNGIETFKSLYNFIDDNINDVTDIYIYKIVADNKTIFTSKE